MKKQNLWGIQVEIDEAATAAWYTDSSEWGCDCDDCQYFLELAKHRELPEPILAALDELNIAPEKATYVCEMMPKDGGHLYQFSYRIAGRILNEDVSKSVVTDWGEVQCCHEPYPHGAPGYPTPHFDLEFWVTLPFIPEFKEMYFDRSEKDNSKWMELISDYLKRAKRFEIHCWKEETEWIELALQYGEIKEDDWMHGKIVVGDVTPQFVEMLLNLPKPTDTELENKMTPFFNVFLDDNFQSCHYGTENYYR